MSDFESLGRGPERPPCARRRPTHSSVLVLARWMLVGAILCLPARGIAQTGGEAVLTVALVKMPYSGSRNVPELSVVPDYLEAGGLVALLQGAGVEVAPVAQVALTPVDEREYGEWHRLGLANGHLAEIVARNTRAGRLSVGLLANCSSLMGMLGGLQQSGSDRLRVGLVWIDAHGDFNTPETTLSGMLGGMPVAVSAGLALHRLRRESGLDPALHTDDIVMAGVRDLDPLERELVEQHAIAQLSVADVRERSDRLHAEMQRLSARVDVIYVHVDMDVLDPAEVPGHGLTVADGPSSAALAAALTEMFRYEKTAALGIASTPSGERDPEGVSRQAAYNLIVGAIAGVQKRMGGR